MSKEKNSTRDSLAESSQHSTRTRSYRSSIKSKEENKPDETIKISQAFFLSKSKETSRNNTANLVAETTIV